MAELDRRTLAQLRDVLRLGPKQLKMVLGIIQQCGDVDHEADWSGTVTFKVQANGGVWCDPHPDPVCIKLPPLDEPTARPTPQPARRTEMALIGGQER